MSIPDRSLVFGIRNLLWFLVRSEYDPDPLPGYKGPTSKGKKRRGRKGPQVMEVGRVSASPDL